MEKVIKMSWESLLKIVDADIGDWDELLKEITQLSLEMRKAFNANDYSKAESINEEILVKSRELGEFYSKKWHQFIGQRPEFEEDLP